MSADPSSLIADHYERHARAWDADRRMSAWNDKRWHDRFVAELPEGATVLDLGCGGGEPVARNLVERGFRVTGIDTSPSLIGLCRERMPDQEWIVGDMRTLSLGSPFDAILAWDSFFHLAHDDQRGMFDVFAQHAAVGATLMFNAGPSHGEAFGSYRGEPLYHASLSPAEYEAALCTIAFEIIYHAVESDRNGGRTAWIARSVRSN